MAKIRKASACQTEGNQLVALTSDSSGGEFIYFLINPIIQPIFLVASTAHLRFFIIGASPVAFSSISTKIQSDNRPSNRQLKVYSQQVMATATSLVTTDHHWE